MAEVQTINFFICNLDSRCAACVSRHVDKCKNQPVALCEAETRSKGGMRVFTEECPYRSVLAVNLSTVKAASPVDDNGGDVDEGKNNT